MGATGWGIGPDMPISTKSNGPAFHCECPTPIKELATIPINVTTHLASLFAFAAPRRTFLAAQKM
jgi:hypothetical protein